jgi:MYXO-CTERM domain-containing protein
MSTSEPTQSTDSSAANDPETIREEIERTRGDLADTVDALHAKLDVKTQAKRRIGALRQQATTDDGKPRPELLAGGAVAVLLVAALVWWRRR